MTFGLVPYSQIIALVISFVWFFFPIELHTPVLIGFAFSHYILGFFYSKNEWSSLKSFAKVLCLILIMVLVFNFHLVNVSYIVLFFGCHWGLSEAFTNKELNRDNTYLISRVFFYTLMYWGLTEKFGGIVLGNDKIQTSIILTLFVTTHFLSKRKGHYPISTATDLSFLLTYFVLRYLYPQNVILLNYLTFFHLLVWTVRPAIKLFEAKEIEAFKRFVWINGCVGLALIATSYFIEHNYNNSTYVMLHEFNRWAGVHMISTLFMSQFNFNALLTKLRVA